MLRNHEFTKGFEFTLTIVHWETFLEILFRYRGLSLETWWLLIYIYIYIYIYIFMQWMFWNLNREHEDLYSLSYDELFDFIIKKYNGIVFTIVNWLGLCNDIKREIFSYLYKQKWRFKEFCGLLQDTWPPHVFELKLRIFA